MYNKKDFYIGQKVLLSPDGWRDKERWAVVEKIGHKYITVGRYFIRVEKGSVKTNRYEMKDYGTRGKFFFSKEEHEDFDELNLITRELLDSIKNGEIKNLETAKKIKCLIEEQ